LVDNSLIAKPFLKWAGGKRQLLPQILPHVPKNFGTYFEPFLGGGALFFALKPQKAVISDINTDLVFTYLGIQNDVEEVIKQLGLYQNNLNFFLKIRDEFEQTPKTSCNIPHCAAMVIYLNKTCFNGLYRVNKKGKFNVSFGKYKNPNIRNEENLRNCSIALENTKISQNDYKQVLNRAQSGDFVYFDPPYHPVSDTSFTSYTSSGFRPKDQEELYFVALELKNSGVSVLLSNSSCDFIRKLYEKDFTIEEVQASRNINCNAEKRGKITELLIY
jgi:DNA adenine methylase